MARVPPKSGATPLPEQAWSRCSSWRHGAPLPDPADEGWIPSDDVLWLLAPREAPGASRWFDGQGDGEVLTEDRNAILRLQERSIAEAQRS